MSHSSGCAQLELSFARAAWHRGVRYYMSGGYRSLSGTKLPESPDLVFPTRRVVVFVDGCFWHGCPTRHVSSQRREIRPLASRPDERWAMDFMSDELFDGQRIRILTLVDHSGGPHHQDSGEAKIRESTVGVSRKPSSDGKARGCSSKHLCGLTAWNT